MDRITIRPACLKDLDTLLRFEQGVIATERPFDPTLQKGPIQYYDLKEMIADPQIELVVAELNNKLIGSGYARIEAAKPYLRHARHAYLGFMYVEPVHRGTGVNKRIIEALKHWAHSQHITELRLDVYYNNESAIRAYEKVGFTRHMVEMRLPIN
jgi:RimJ/RimL family protein N-acetyltransferase